MLKEHARTYYVNKNYNCAISVLMAANDEYALGLQKEDMALLSGFGGGMGCGTVCGALSASIAVLGRLYGEKEGYRPKEKCAAFVAEFEKALGATDCKTLKAKYHTDTERCFATVALACDTLEAFINRIEAKSTSVHAPALSAADIKRVKALGFLQHKDTALFNARVITRNGRVTTDELAAVTAAAQNYGDGHVMMTTRLTMEVSGIAYENIDAFREELAKAGLETGGTGSKVRPVVSCKGTTCQYGLYDTYALSEEIHERFYHGYASVALPHKFKIAVGGCPNNCVKPDLNDVGIIGQYVPHYHVEDCRSCKKCALEASCPIHAAKVVDGKLVIDAKACNHCGRCIGKCPFHCNDTGTYGWRICIGGRWGKHVAQGKMLSKLFTDKEELLRTVEKAILLFREQGISGERFAQTIERLGFENVQAQLLSDDLMDRKNSILGLNVVGGATC